MRRLCLLIALALAVLSVGAATVWGQEQGAQRKSTRHRHGSAHHRAHHHRRHAGRRHRKHRPRRHHPSRPGAPTGPVPIPSAPTGAASPDPCPSGPPASTQSLGAYNYALEGMDTFTKAAPVGSFTQARNDQIVYAGDHGMDWTGYPDGAPSTYSDGAQGYEPSTVLSVHDGVLDFYLHNDAHGNPVGAAPSPLPAGNRYQTYGAWSFCERLAPSDSHDLADFHQAPLLWPQSDSDSRDAESDYPEADLNALDFSAYAHYGGSGAQDAFNIQSVDPGFDPTQWHVYTQAWGPGVRSYFVDGRLVGTSTNQVWAGPERWVLQVEPLARNDGDSGHVYVKWVWIGTLS